MRNPQHAALTTLFLSSRSPSKQLLHLMRTLLDTFSDIFFIDNDAVSFGCDRCGERLVVVIGTNRVRDSKPKRRSQCFHAFSKICQKWEVCRMTKTTCAPDAKNRPLKRADGTSPSRNDHRNALIVQDGCSCWIQSFSAKKRKIPGRSAEKCEPRNRLHLEPQWTLDTNAHHRSETSGIAERVV